MIEGLGLLFADGSMLVMPAGTSFETVEQEAQESDFDEPERRTRVVRLKIEITSVFESPTARTVSGALKNRVGEPTLQPASGHQPQAS